jgi:hypothetical protein
MMRSYRAYRVAATALAVGAATDNLLEEDEEDDDRYTMGASSSRVRFTLERGLDRAGDAVLQPGAALSAEVNVYDGCTRLLNWTRKDIRSARLNAADLRLYVETHKLFLRNQSPASSPAGMRLARYSRLWRSFLTSEASSQREVPLRWSAQRPDRGTKTPAGWLEALDAWQYSLSNAEFALLIGKWGPWAIGTKRSDEDQLTAAGPPMVVKVFSRAEIKGLQFCSQEYEARKKACDSIVMIRSESAAGSSDRPSAEFGRVQAFMEIRVPPSDPEAPVIYAVDAEWFERPDERDAWTGDIDCPAVCKKTYNDRAGNLWDLFSIVPTKVILAPHLQKPVTLWQVLHVDSDFMTRDYRGL